MGNNCDNEYLRTIWDNFLKGDKKAFSIIYNRYVDSLYGYGYRITPQKDLVEDAIQDLFIDLLRYGNSLKNIDSLEYYLLKSLKRIILRRKKNEARFLKELESDYEFDFRFDLELEEVESKNQRLSLLKEELQKLSSQKRELIYLRFYNGLTNVEIADLLDIKPDTVKKQIQRIVKYLHGNLKESSLYLLFCRFSY